MPTALLFDRVSKCLPRQPILDGVDFAVQAGESFALVGCNGAGKTTLMKCLLDFCRVTHGGIEIFGVPHADRSARERLAFLPERFSAPYFLTGRKFLAVMLELHGGRDADIESTVVAIDLDPAALDRPVRLYSKGMTQKLGLVACLASGKPLLVLDEPMSGLDPLARARLKAELRALKARGVTLFFTSHALADVTELADRLAVLHDGKLRFVGTPADLVGRHDASDLEQAFLACIA